MCRHCFFALLILFISKHQHAQRLVPLISEGTAYPFETISTVYDMEVVNEKLIIGGSFTDLNGMEFDRIMSWDGHQMQSFDDTLAGRVTCIKEYEGTTVIGNRASSSIHYVKKWSGSVWEDMGGAFSDDVLDIEVHDNVLYAAGRFENTIKKWDGSQWNNEGTLSYSNSKGLLSSGNRLYTFFDDSIPAFFENGELHLLTSEYDTHRAYGMNKKDGDVYFTGVFQLGSDVVGMLKVEGSNLVLDPEAVFVEDRFEALYANNHWYSYDFIYVYIDEEMFLRTEPVNSNFTAKRGVKLVEFLGEVHLYTDPHQFIPFVSQSDGGHVYKVSDGATLSDIHADGHQMHVHLEPAELMLDTRFANLGINYPADSLTRPHFGNVLIASATVGADTLAAGTEYQYSNSEGWTFGPIADQLNQTFFDRYMRTWKVTRTDINAHIANHDSPGYITPDGIASWPGNGDTENGVSFRLAPFVDVNNNMYYEPHLGDYPEILGDEAMYMILNDRFTNHSYLFNLDVTPTLVPMDLEAHVMYYTFANQPDPIDKTLFMRSAIYNRSSNDYLDLRLGMLSDFDIGNPFGDYVGCDSLLNYAFAYNKTNFDNDTIVGDFYKEGYGLNPPATACIYLNHEIVSNIATSNSTSSLLPALPSRVMQIYNEMHGKTGTGGSFMSDGINTTPMMFSDSPCLVGGENEITTQIPSMDRVQVTATDDITLLAGDYVCMDVAITVTDQSMDNISNACSLSDIVPLVQQYYDENNLNACSFITNVENKTNSIAGFQIYPVPANNEINIRFQKLSTGNDEITVHDALGNVVLVKAVGNGLTSKTMSLSNLSDGVYFLKYQNQSARFVISR